jgi:hypothetical protein
LEESWTWVSCENPAGAAEEGDSDHTQQNEKGRTQRGYGVQNHYAMSAVKRLPTPPPKVPLLQAFWQKVTAQPTPIVSCPAFPSFPEGLLTQYDLASVLLRGDSCLRVPNDYLRLRMINVDNVIRQEFAHSFPYQSVGTASTSR